MHAQRDPTHVLQPKDDTDLYDEPWGPTILGGVLLFALAAIFTSVCVCVCVCVCARARIRVREFSRSNPRFVELLRSSLLSLCVTRVCTGSC